MQLFVDHPAWLNPTIIPGLPFRWYGLMYVAAFVATYLLFMKQSKRLGKPIDKDEALSFFMWGVVGLVLGARVFYMVIYNPDFLSAPWLTFWPFDPSTGAFTGFSGMSYHGGLIGLVIAFWLYAKRKKVDFLEWGDLVAASAPLGYTFGRLGNFINGELWGRVTDAPWGMRFPDAPALSTKDAWVREAAEKVGIDPSQPLVNLPRHPSQLYEALFEGVVSWLILWFIVSKRTKTKGMVIAWYAILYGTFRFVIEYFREPDKQMGYPLYLAPSDLPPAVFTSVFNISTGQILCFFMIAGGLAMMAILKKREAMGLNAAPQAPKGGGGKKKAKQGSK
jgi:phosphatidylglycerol:prolipoprotein diacylglycerol transferase